MVLEEPEGFSTEAAFCLFYIGLHVYSVLIVAALSMALTRHTRKYTKRKSMSLDPEAPWCECGQYKCQKSEGSLGKNATGAAQTRAAPLPRRRLPLARLTRRLKLDPRSSRKRDL